MLARLRAALIFLEMKNKKIVFEGYDEHHARMVARLRYDSITQGDFFRGIVQLYIEKDESILLAVDKIKQKCSTMGKKKRKATQREYSLGQELLSDLALSTEEENFLYDIIEEDFE